MSRVDKSIFGFCHSDWIDDWFVLDGAPFGQPEGTAEHWRAIITAMRSGTNHRESRVGAYCNKASGRYEIFSPRNAYGARDFVEVFASEVEDFCRKVEAELAKYDDRVSCGAGI